MGGLWRGGLVHVAQRMAALVVGAGEAAADGRCLLAAAQHKRCGGQAEEGTALHQ